jgi:hypothetical protein
VLDVERWAELQRWAELRRQVPGEHHELARHRDDGDIRSVPGDGPLSEGAQGPALREATQAASTSTARTAPGP